jgi:hypothetical protein
MITELPSKFVTMLKGREADATAAFNAFAGLGALYSDESTIRIGSRLTIYEKDDAWKKLHLPLLFVTTVCGTEAILGGARRVMAKEGNRGGILSGQRTILSRWKAIFPACFCVRGEF